MTHTAHTDRSAGARFITLEGIDGAGKTSSARTVRERLDAHGIPHIITHEPGGSDFGRALRNLLLHQDGLEICPDAETLAMFAARAEHLKQTVRPALAAGKWVVSDRFTDSTYAYQGGGRGVATARIAQLERWVHEDLQPDLTLLFDIDSAAARLRTMHGQRALPEFDRFHEESNGFQERVCACYQQRSQDEPQRFRVIDGGAEVSAVAAQVGAILDELIGATAKKGQGG